MMVYSDVGKTLNNIDVTCLKMHEPYYYGSLKEMALFSVVGRKILDGRTYYMIVPISHFYCPYDNETGNYDGATKYDVLISRRAIDVTESDILYLEKNNYIYYKDWRDRLDELLLCTDGNYDDSLCVPFARYVSPDFGMVAFCKGDGTLCSLMSDTILEEFTIAKKKLLFASIGTGTGRKIKFEPGTVFSRNISEAYIAGRELSFISLLWKNGLECVTKKRLYLGLSEIDEFVGVFEKYEKSVQEIAGIYGSLSYGVITSRPSGLYMNDDRWEHLIRTLFIHYTPLMQHGNWLSGSYKKELTLNGHIFTLRLKTENIFKEDGVDYAHYFDSNYRYDSSHICFLRDEKLCIRGVLEGIYNSNCLYCTVEYDFQTQDVTYSDVKVYDITSPYYLSGSAYADDFGAAYYYLTNDNTYYNKELIDLTSTSSISNLSSDSENNSKICELNIDSLLEHMQSLGYTKKTSKTIPDVAFMSMHRSAWLNENEFVSLRQYKGSGKVINLVDLYQGGKYKGSISGNFDVDILDKILKSREFNDSISQGTNSVIKVQKVVADQYNKNGRNSISYKQEDLFLDYAKSYIMYRHTKEKIVAGDVIARVARLRNTDEYCIILQLAYYGISGALDSQFYILCRTKTEKDMFKVFTEQFKKNASAIKGFKLSDLPLANYLGVSTTYAKIQTYNALKNRGKHYKDQHFLTRVLLKNLGFIPHATWRDVCYDVPDEIFNLMIFD